MQIELMSERLQQVLKDFIIKNGSKGKAELCAAVSKSPVTVDRWLRDGLPTAHDAYLVALACGCTQEEALDLAKDSFPDEATKAG